MSIFRPPGCIAGRAHPLSNGDLSGHIPIPQSGPRYTHPRGDDQGSQPADRPIWESVKEGQKGPDQVSLSQLGGRRPEKYDGGEESGRRERK